MGQQLTDVRTEFLQGGDEWAGQGVVGLVRGFLFFHQGVPLAVQTVQRFFQGMGRGMAQATQGGVVQLRGVHLPAALDQVVRFVHQHTHTPVFVDGLAKKLDVEVEEMVVIPHHHIAPAHQLLAQVIRADRVVQRQFTQGGFVQCALYCARLHRRLARLRQAIIKTPGQRAGIAMAGLVGVFTSFAFGDQLQHAQGQGGRLVLQQLQGVQRQLAARRFGGEVKHFVQTLAGHGLEHREQRAHGFADAGGRLGHQAAPGDVGFVDRFGQPTLTRAKFGVRELKV